MRIPSPQEISAKQTKNGGWTKQQLKEWGVSWPPKHGWRKKLEALYAWKITKQLNNEFESALIRDSDFSQNSGETPSGNSTTRKN